MPMCTYDGGRGSKLCHFRSYALIEWPLVTYNTRKMKQIFYLVLLHFVQQCNVGGQGHSSTVDRHVPLKS